jgi:hypothetical protein
VRGRVVEIDTSKIYIFLTLLNKRGIYVLHVDSSM